jgi:hypothetical protein
MKRTENGKGPQGVEFGKEGGGLEVFKREEEDSLPVENREKDEENGNSPRALILAKKVADFRLTRGKKKKTDL